MKLRSLGPESRVPRRGPVCHIGCAMHEDLRESPVFGVLSHRSEGREAAEAPYSELSGSSFELSDSDQASVVQIEAAPHGIDARQSAVQIDFPSHS